MNAVDFLNSNLFITILLVVVGILGYFLKENISRIPLLEKEIKTMDKQLSQQQKEISDLNHRAKTNKELLQKAFEKDMTATQELFAEKLNSMDNKLSSMEKSFDMRMEMMQKTIEAFDKKLDRIQE